MIEDSTTPVVIRKQLPVSQSRAFDAWTDPVGMRVWMCPGDIQSTEMTLDLRVGGALLVVMHGPNGVYEHRGEFTIVDRPRRLAFTWIAKATEFQATLVTVDFLAIGDNSSEIVITHRRLPPPASEQYLGGWSQIADRLARYLASSA